MSVTTEQLASCTCDECVALCVRSPGWMTPAEAGRAIDAGLARSLMRDWLEPSKTLGNRLRIFVLAPAVIGHAGRDAPEMRLIDLLEALCGGGSWSKGRCGFLSAEGRCGIHDSGFKPVQCRSIVGCVPMSDAESGPGNYDIARMWNTAAGRAVLRRWYEAVDAKSP
jgi:hypothetical protein